MNRIYIGFDKRQPEAYAVCKHSLDMQLRKAGNVGFLDIRTQPLVLDDLRDYGLYWRPTTEDAVTGNLWDDISDAPMATGFAISRFLVPHLAKREGWALFHDCDMLWRGNPRELFKLADPRYAVMCVQHQYAPPVGVKMDGQQQTQYARKNWSSFMLFNCAHPANARLDVDLVNALPGRDLHRFCWLRDDEIGALPLTYNWLPGHSPADIDPQVVHFTEGGPWLRDYQDVPYADEWRAVRRHNLYGDASC